MAYPIKLKDFPENTGISRYLGNFKIEDENNPHEIMMSFLIWDLARVKRYNSCTSGHCGQA